MAYTTPMNHPEAVFLCQLGSTMHTACSGQNANKAACLDNGCLWTHWFRQAFFRGRVRSMYREDKASILISMFCMLIYDSPPRIRLHSPFSAEATATSRKNGVSGCDHATPAEPNQDPVNLEIKAVSFDFLCYNFLLSLKT